MQLNPPCIQEAACMITVFAGLPGPSHTHRLLPYNSSSASVLTMHLKHLHTHTCRDTGRSTSSHTHSVAGLEPATSDRQHVNGFKLDYASNSPRNVTTGPNDTRTKTQLPLHAFCGVTAAHVARNGTTTLQQQRTTDPLHKLQAQNKQAVIRHRRQVLQTRKPSNTVPLPGEATQKRHQERRQGHARQRAQPVKLHLQISTG